MTTQADRIEQLEQQNEGLRSELALMHARLEALEAVTKPPPALRLPPQSDKRQVRIEPAPIPLPAFMPTDEELARLLAMVRERYSVFRPRVGTSAEADRGYFDCVKGAFRWICTIGRTAEPNTRLSYDMLCNKCLQHLRAVSAAPPTMPYGAIMVAAIAAGDVVYDDPISAPFPWSYLGLAPDLQRTYAGAYKQILVGERDFLKPIVKLQRASNVQLNFGETSVPHVLRARGELP